MFWLILGILLWFFGHGFKAQFPRIRENLNKLLGTEKAKGPFAIAILLSFALIIYGWRHADALASLYSTAEALNLIAGILIGFGVYLFIGSTANIRIRQWIRHPQLTGLCLWSIAHLLVNGEYRSLVLFGGLGLWSITMMLCINRRDGKYIAPIAGSIKDEIKPIIISLIVTMVLTLTHGFYSAASLMPG